MGASVELSVASVVVEVGGEASLQVTVRNTGSVIDELSFSVLGAAGAWTVIEPGLLSLLPGSEGTAQVHFRPPRSASIPAGRTPFGIMVASREDPEGSIVEEGTVEVTRLVEVAAELNPRTSRGRREGTHDLTVSNRGNATITVEVAATDPGDLLYLTVTPPQLVIEAGGSGTARIVAQARWELEQGSPQTIPFKVTVTPEGDAATTIDGALVQEPKEEPKPTPAEAAAAAPAPAAAPPAAPPKPSQLPKLLAGLLALAVVGGGIAAVATGAVKVGGGGGGGNGGGSDTTAATTTTVDGTTTTSGGGGDGIDPSTVLPDIKASSTANPSVDGAGEPISFEAGNMIDNNPKTTWRAEGDGEGIIITMTWPQAAHFRKIGLDPGWDFTDPASGDDRFAQNRTIDQVTWFFVGSANGIERQSFKQKAGVQQIDVDHVATTVTLKINATLPAQQGDRDFTAISDIAFS
jgi:hypothetical protein